jgi:multidrug efflux system membrane fusion protein
MTARAAVLTEEVLKAMLYKKIKVGVVLLLAVAGILVAGGGLALHLRADLPTARAVAPAEDSAVPASGAQEKAPPAEAKVKAVTVSRPLRRQAIPYEYFTGRLEPGPALQVRARAGGRVDAAYVKNGDRVKKGDLLFDLVIGGDNLAALKLLLQTAQAGLDPAEANRKLAESKLERLLKLAKGPGKLPQAVVDQAGAEVATAKAAVEAARAAYEHARQQLSAARVLAPADGVILRRPVDVGTEVSGGENATALALLGTLDPIGARFDMDERSYLRWQRLLRAGQVKKTGSPLAMGLADEEGYPHKGTLTSFEGKFNPETGTVGAHGTFPNPDKLFLPGMWARVRLAFGKARPVLEVPDAAILRGEQGKAYVLVVNERHIAEWRRVKLAELDPASDLRVVEEGLRPDDWVIVQGVSGVRPGDRVEPRREKPRRPGP